MSTDSQPLVWLEVLRPLRTHPRRPRPPLDMQGQPILETRYLQPGELIQVTEEDRKMYYQFHTRQCGGPAAVPATLFPQPEVAVAVAPHMEADEPAPAPAEKEADDPIPVFKPAPKPRKKS